MSSTRRTVLHAVDRLSLRTVMASPARQEVKRDKVSQIVLGRELELGALFVKEIFSKKPYYGTTEEVFSLTDTREVSAYLHDHYGLNASGEWMKATLAEFVTKGLRRGEKLVGRRFTAFDVNTEILYITRWDGRVRKLDGQTIEEVVNGEEVFFLDDDHGVDVDDPDIGPHGELLPFLTDLTFAKETLGNMSPDQQRMLLTVWFFAVAFPDLVTSKPILVIEGAPGSGKSTSALMFQAVIHGKEHGMIVSKDGEKDFPVQLLRSPIAIFDNVDSFIDWMPDAICAYTTVGKWEKRKLYSDDENMTIAPMSFPVIASKNPSSFRREDVADRSIILRLDRREGATGFKPMQHLMADLRNKRARLFGEYLYWCNQIVAAIRAGLWAQCEAHVTGFRQADFAQMAFLVGSVLGWDVEDVAASLDALTEEQKAHAGENDDLADVMIAWVRQYGAMNKDNYLSAREIFAQIEQQANASGRKLKFTENVLASKLRMGYLDTRFEIDKRIDHVSHQHTFLIKTNKLTVLTGGLADVIPMISSDFNKPLSKTGTDTDDE